MARQYRQTVTRNGTIAGASGTLVASITPLDVEQVPSGYVGKVKVSVIPQDQQTNNAASFLVIAGTDENPSSALSSDTITAQAVPDGGGTVWLSLKRPIRSSDEEDDRNDGAVYIHVFTQGGVLTHVVTETWGRFMKLTPAP